MRGEGQAEARCFRFVPTDRRCIVAYMQVALTLVVTVVTLPYVVVGTDENTKCTLTTMLVAVWALWIKTPAQRLLSDDTQ